MAKATPFPAAESARDLDLSPAAAIQRCREKVDLPAKRAPRGTPALPDDDAAQTELVNQLIGAWGRAQ